MKKFKVTVSRVDTWQAEVEVMARTPEDAAERIERRLEKGWSEVFGDEDGDYLECHTGIEDVACAKCGQSVETKSWGGTVVTNSCDCKRKGKTHAS